jgi:hypothetical protein
VGNSTHRSKTDSDARLARKSLSAPATLCHSVTYVMDNKSSIILGADIGRPDKKSDCAVALNETLKVPWRYHLRPKSLGADKGYNSGEFLHGVMEARIVPYIPMIDYRSQNDQGIYPIDVFTFDAVDNSFVCPQGKKLIYSGMHGLQQVYRASRKDCRICPDKGLCTRDASRSLSYHIYESSMQRARELTKTPAYRISQRMRKRIEELFGEAKEFMGLRRAKFRLHRFVREQVLMTAMAQNIKRMVKALSRRERGEEVVIISLIVARPIHFLRVALTNRLSGEQSLQKPASILYGVFQQPVDI